ncbi:LppU/SCO3897 family protein [Micromonospora sp. DT43]|uniref:LppU/SCO3897 family protein n=1 Tax=Micromonospora sp. DT43 TaxID=3393440 RepID=UPI003CED29A8
MTSEGPHRPGQEPDEVSPGAGGPASYGDRPAQPDNGYDAAGPDLGWAPPPPARPNSSATPAWATQSEQQPNPAWGAAAAPQPSDPAQPAWATGGGAPEQGQPTPWTPPQQGWTPPEQAAPAWSAGSAEQPDWAQAQPAARGAAQVPPATATWPAAQDDPSRSGGWAAGGAQDDPSRSGGWAAGAAQANPPAADWNAEPAQPASRAGAAGPQDDPSGSGGWAVGAAAREDQPVWTPAEQAPQTWGQPAGQTEQPSPAWGQTEPASARGAAQVPTPNWNAQEEAPQPGAWGGAEGRPQQPDWVLSPQDQPAERPEPTAWPQAEQAGPATARASVSVPGNDATPGWAAAGPDNPPQASSGVAEVQPWAPGEVWGRAEAEASAQSRGGWDADRADEPPIYQPAPAPGISPANAVPLPPQEQRVPGASLAAAPPADYAPSTQYPPIPEQPAYAEREAPDAAAPYEAEPAAWGRAEEASASAAVVPAPRTSPESGAGRAVVPVSDADSAAGAAGRASASASVPLASRVMPPADQAMRPTSAATPQPRVYGRPTQPEPDNEPEQAALDAFQAEPSPERPGIPDWQQDAGRQATPDWQQAPERPATPDWQQDAGRPGAPDWQQAPERPATPEWQQDAGRPGAPDWQQAPERPATPDWQNGPDRQGFPGWGDDSPSEPQFDDRDRASAPNGFGEPTAAAAPPAFPPGVPSFVDAPGNNRPVNGVRPQSGGDRPADRFGAPATGAAAVGSAPSFGEQAPGGQFPAFPPPQQPVPSWGQEATESDQGRFDAFKPDAEEPKVEAPAPKVRNGRVLAAVLVAAVLILAVPLGLLMLLGKFGGGDDSKAFDPAVGTCVKQVGQGASAVNCGEAGAFTVVSKVDAKEKCADPAQPHVVLPGEGTNRVLCLKPATK